MLILNKFRLNDVISFDLLIESVLPQDYNNVKVKSIIDDVEAARQGYDVHAIHSMVYRILPKGTIADDPSSYHYIVVETQDGQRRCVGLPWINEETIRVHDQSVAVFRVVNIDPSDAPKIRDVIARYGYYCELNIE